MFRSAMIAAACPRSPSYSAATTVADLWRVTPWLWVICSHCQHRSPTAFAPWIIPWVIVSAERGGRYAYSRELDFAGCSQQSSNPSQADVFKKKEDKPSGQAVTIVPPKPPEPQNQGTSGIALCQKGSGHPHADTYRLM